MTAKRDVLDKLASVILIACGVVISGSVAYRTFASPAEKGTPVHAAAPRLVQNWNDAYVAGTAVANSRAPVTIVEIEDLQCPACRRFQQTLHELLKEYPDKLGLVVVSYPLDYHTYAMSAARATECAGRFGRTREWMDAVFAKQDSLGAKSWGSFAVDAGIPDSGLIARCAVDTANVPHIKAGIAYADRVGIEGTPTVLVNGWRLGEVPTKARLKLAIDTFLKGENPFTSGRWATQ